ncbi:transposase, partial [Bacillus cereus]
MKNSYQQLTQNLEYLKLKQMVQHLGEVVDFSINNQLSFIET